MIQYANLDKEKMAIFLLENHLGTVVVDRSRLEVWAQVSRAALNCVL